MNIKKNTSVRINLLNLLYQSVLLTIRLLGHNNIYVSKDKPFFKTAEFSWLPQYVT